MNSSSAESLFQKLKTYADNYKLAKCYWVQILATDSFNEKWTGIINGKEYSHSRVHKISGDRFYQLLTGQDDALSQLLQALPKATADYLKSAKTSDALAKNSALAEIKEGMSKSGRTMIDQINFENYSYYLGFDKL